MAFQATACWDKITSAPITTILTQAINAQEVDICMDKNLPWYVVHTKPRQEKIVLENLLRQSYRAYLPYIRVVKRARGKIEIVLDPMFPRYCFFQPAHAEHSIAPVNSTFGVSRIVRFGASPACVAGSVVDQVQSFEAQQQAAGFSAIAPYRPGQLVLIDGGPLKGLEGLVSEVAEERVVVLLSLLGREARVEVQPGWVSAA